MSCELQVGQYLSSVDWKDNLDGLHFDDHRVVHQQIDSKTAVKLKPLVPEWHLDLALNLKATALQFVFKALLVDALEQAWTESLMNLKRGVDDDAGNLVNGVGYRRSL